MSKTMFAPGPWIAITDGPRVKDYSAMVATGTNIASTRQAICCKRSGETRAEDEANARLIAAAPELYNACELALTRLDDGTEVSANIAKHVRAALAKARGEP